MADLWTAHLWEIVQGTWEKGAVGCWGVQERRKFQKVKLLESMISDHSSIKLEIHILKTPSSYNW